VALGCGCFEVVVDSDRFATTTWRVGSPRRGCEVISKEEGNNRLAPSSFHVGWLIFVSRVINFRLETVIIPRCFCSEVVVRAACTLTTTSMLSAVGCVGVVVKLLYGAINTLLDLSLLGFCKKFLMYPNSSEQTVSFSESEIVLISLLNETSEEKERKVGDAIGI